MLNEIKEFMATLEEELKYRDSVVRHKKGLESTLWGLEEQVRFPENSSKEDQEQITEEINHCRMKIMSCGKVVDSHTSKLKNIVNNFKLE